MKTTQEIEREAALVLCTNNLCSNTRMRDSACIPCQDRARDLSAAGLLATPTMIECAEACVAHFNRYGRLAETWTDRGNEAEVLRVIEAGRAHSVTLAKPEPAPFDVDLIERALLSPLSDGSLDMRRTAMAELRRWKERRP